VRAPDEGVELASLRRGTLTWQRVYWTGDALRTVRQWYATRWAISPASDTLHTGECQPLTHSRLLLRLEHTVTVVLCTLPGGTRLVVNERVTLWP
jgi:hypothetical protein